MCEFCTKHGEGKKWYLQMKNYSEELIHHALTHDEQEITGGADRVTWLQRFFGDFVMPAITGKASTDEHSSTEAAPAKVPVGLREMLRRQQLVHFGQVIPIEDVERILDGASSITRMPCGCRFLTTGKTDQRYCFGLGMDKWGVFGKFPEAASSLETLEKSEAKRIIRSYDEEGLMHSVWTGVTPYVVGICNCDHDCGAYRATIEKRTAQVFFRAEYVCQVDWELCTGCKSCLRQCQFGSQFYSSALSKVYIDPARCYGCGVCRTACTAGAIRLLPRTDVPEAAKLWLRKSGE